MNYREELFVHEYIINGGNAYQAAISAGYAESTASVANEWLTETLTDTDKKRHLPYKPELLEAINEEIARIEDEAIAKEKEVMRYFTSVMRKEARSKVVVTEGTGNGVSKARLMERPPDEKEALDAAKTLARIYGLSNKVELDADTTLNINIDYGSGGDP